MSKKRIRKVMKGHGGLRDGAGHPKTGITKQKICVSVDKRNWQDALEKWRNKSSWLVDKLVRDYLANSGSALETETAI
jgi:hypothetical protein